MGKITVSNLGKAYKQYPTRWSRLREWLTPGKRKYHQTKWVLKDINFEVQPGEAVGIIGINGAGKSTLLKLITGTAHPTEGSVHMTGRVAAMLELGMGFHPDFTGRQNAFMAGQLLGFSSDEIAQLMPEIEAFAEIGDYIDQPVRVYSSGMQMRLAFSVATAIRPDILIVDEALSVGDAYFQHKSFSKIRDFRDQGTTLLLVSHDKQIIQSVCDKAILLRDGKIVSSGNPEMVMDYYTAIIANTKKTEIKVSSENGAVNSRTESGTLDAEISTVVINSESNKNIELINVGELVYVEIEVLIKKNLDNLVLGFGVKDRLGQMVFGTNTKYTNQKIEKLKAGEKVYFEVMFNANLGPGTYSIHCSLVGSGELGGDTYHWVERAKIFEVFNRDKIEFVGVVYNNINFKISR